MGKARVNSADQRNIVHRYGAMAALFCTFFVAVFFSFQTLFDQKRLIEKESKINIWFLAQTEIELLRLQGALKAFRLEETGVDRNAVEERFELFWSRLPILLNGPQSAGLRQVEGLAETATNAIETLKTLEPLVQSLDRRDRETIVRLEARLDQLRHPLHEMVQRALTYDADLASAERKAHEVYYYQLLVLFGGLLAGGALLFVMFHLQIRRAKRLSLEARAAETEARVARQQLVLAIGSVSEGFILYDEQDRVVLFNDRYRELHPTQAATLREGATFAQLLRETVQCGGIAVPPGNDSEAWIERCLEAHRQPGAPFETRLNGGTWLMISERRTGTGGIVGIHTDISELKHREAELMRQSSLLQATFENINQGIAVFDNAQRLVTWNDRFVELHALPTGIVRVGLPYTELAQRYGKTTGDEAGPGEPQIEQHLRLIRSASSGATAPLCFERRRPNGTVIEIAIQPTPDGGFIKTYSDITERVRAEEQRMQWLEGQVEKRTRQLRAEVKEREAAQAQLAQTQKIESVGQLTGGIAHDFNNLLTAVLGNLELLDRHVPNEAGRKLLRGALSAAERGASLTQRLLAFARSQRLEPRRVDVDLLVTDMHDLLARSLGPAVQLTRTVAPDLWPARVDPSQLENAILNLAINARDAMTTGGVLTIGLSNARSGGADAPLDVTPSDYVVITVADTGSGMDEATLARAFEPFFTTKGVGKGTGLGLAMVHGIAAQSGGAARIRSTLGVGTTVEIWLPRAQRLDVARQMRLLDDKPAPGHGTVLVCDDEPAVREFVATVLRECGYRVVEAAGGRAALSILHTDEPVDVLVVDFAMPEMTGGAVARAARAHRPALPTVIITRYADTRMLETEAAGIPLLHKPFKPAALATCVAELMQRGSIDSPALRLVKSTR
jgi:signal transduction histidine kinase/ActR/RegA family two-component response regulator